MQMEQLREEFYIVNGKLLPTNDFKELENPNGVIVYEVFRVVSGISLFLEDHMARFKNSMLQARFKTLVDSEAIKDGIKRLISENQVEIGNIKIVACEWGGTVLWQAFFIPYKYPSEADYLAGVGLGVLQAERKNPGAKIIQQEIREAANKLLGDNGFYEVLLVDSEGFIREGSRSNIFFVKGMEVQTPPAATVLNGITRQKVAEILKRSRCIFKEAQISIDDLPGFEAAFLTGTSPKVLPVNSIAEYAYQVQNGIVMEIRQKYDAMVAEYISSHR